MPKVLSIDDSKAVQFLLKDFLSGSPYELECAPEGKTGINLVQEKGTNYYDLILLDWEMPGLTGPEVLDELMKIKIEAPVVMLTTKNDTQDILSVLEKGATEYVMKPFTKDLILEKIETILSQRA